MSTVARSLFVISDLHLGGRAASGADRGFQMMTRPDALAAFIRGLMTRPIGSVELVIDGDFVDFLAEESETPGEWTPLIERPSRAAEVLRKIARDERSSFRQVFVALGELLRAGQRLTLLIGNHDLELSYPEVRRELHKALGLPAGHGLLYLYDGEAYCVGDILIEHGNRYDAFNIVNHDALRRRRSLQSRGQEGVRDDKFAAPAGSHMVAEVMNPVKAAYPFVDLLKPENQTVIPLLLALEPGYRSKLGKVAATLAPAIAHITDPFRGPDVPIRLAEISGAGSSVNVELDEPRADPLTAALADAFGSPAEAQEFLARIETDELAAPVAEVSAGGTLTFASGLLSLLGARKSQALETRFPALLKALRTLQNDQTFALDKDTGPFRKAAQRLAERTGVRCVVFGHTHLARDIDLGNGQRYLNTGTWTNLLRLPQALFGADAQPALQAWVDELRQGRYDAWFRPTYAQLDLDEHDRLLEARLVEFA
jgi:UDP-2,3-diacylglucosamine pyrophosphatase LpxH